MSVVAGRSGLRLLLPVAVLALLSRGGLVLGLALLGVTGLIRGTRRDDKSANVWPAAALAFATWLVGPEPEALRLLRTGAPELFRPGGAYDYFDGGILASLYRPIAVLVPGIASLPLEPLMALVAIVLLAVLAAKVSRHPLVPGLLAAAGALIVIWLDPVKRRCSCCLHRWHATRRCAARSSPAGALDLDDTQATHVTLRRLGAEHVVVPDAVAARYGEVLAARGGESLVALDESVPAEAPCLSPSELRVRASADNPQVAVASRAIDGDPKTRWGSGHAQRPGMFFEIELVPPRELEVVELRHEGFVRDIPRGFRVAIAGPEGRERPWRKRDPYLGEIAWSDPEGIAIADHGASGRTRLGMPPEPVKTVRIELTRSAPIFDWSIAELCVRARKESSPRPSR